MDSEREREETSSSRAQVLRTGLWIFLGLLVVLALLAWLLGSDLLPIEYEGFD